MSFFSARSREEFQQQLLDGMGRLGGGPLPEGMALFASHFFAGLTLEELGQRRLADLAGCCLEAWQLLGHFDPGVPLVRIFSPDHAHNGWQSPHSVVQVLHADMPFLVDSVSMELKRRGYRIHVLQISVLDARRDARGHLLELAPRGAGQTEALIHLEIDRCSEQAEQRQLEQAVQESLAQVRLVVADFAAMQAQAGRLLEQLAASAGDDPEQVEICAFLQWLRDNHFTFLGYEEFSVQAEGEGGRIRYAPESLLGLSRLRRSAEGEPVNAGALAWLRQPQRLAFAKADSLSRVHRPTHPDYVSIRLLDAAGQVQRECRFIGLYTASVYIESVRRIPCIRGKYDEVMRRAGFDPAGHRGKSLAQVLEVLPRDELFQTPVEVLAETAVAIAMTQERNAMRLFLRHDPFGHFCYCLVYVPRDIYSTSTRLKIEKVLRARLQALDCEFWTWFSESALARVQFILRVDPLQPCRVDARALEAEVIQSCRRWEDEFSSLVLESLGEAHGTDLLARFQGSYPAGYRERFAPHQALVDMQHLLSLADGRRLVMSFYQPALQDGQLYCKLYHASEPLPLSDMLPMLENLGLRVLGEYSFPICCQDGSRYWIHDYSFIPAADIEQDPQRLNGPVQEAFIRIVGGEAESDAFNRLVLSAGLGWREVALLRAYGRYLKQIRLGFDLNYIAATLNQHPAIARDLLALFHLRFTPLAAGEHPADCGPTEARILQALEGVQVLSEDRILRRCFELIRATLRTNYYQQDAQGQPRSYLSFKFDPELIPELPRPAPRFEIFVYSPRFEGVHLRFGHVARGGLRWSDREEDYRTEVLGLVKAQQVKNAVIVPVGAKGGFVPRQLPVGGTRDEVQAEAIACYRLFISGLLDLTDNLREGQVLPPPQVRRHDDDDPYLVVAADKGTASFSDIANAVAAGYGFWLGDAFASGGSAGYDHKGMGITARGAWVSVQRHFRERGIDVQRDPIRVVGIGDMAGDVFGNGLLRSASVQLVAAFNHQHIFLDPDPDPAISFAERQRLFALPRSTWADYAPALISEGGGVFPRSAKRIALSAQVRARLDISAHSLTPSELICAILKAPVDLLWNGGIGTYVKASSESHADVGDKANDALRVNGRELRCRVVGEGGNLGMTALGRVEYALAGGACNTDFIDNAGGVTCSDHEVNIKILLGEVLHSGDLTLKQRNQLLAAMTSEVAGAVLDTCYQQTQALSLAERQARQRSGEFRRLIQDLEARGCLDPALEALPAEEVLQARAASGGGLTRPELAVLQCWSKIDLKEALLHSGLPDDPGLAGELRAAFPAVLGERFAQAMGTHRLRREILAKCIANALIDRMGMTFVQRLRESMGRSDAEIAAAWLVIREVFGIERLWRQIEALDGQVEAGLQLDLMEELMRAGRSGVRWLLYNRRENLDIAAEIAHFSAPLAGLLAQLDSLLDSAAAEQLGQRRSQLLEAQIPAGLADAMAASPHWYVLLSVIEAADMTGQPAARVAVSRFAIGQALELSWYRQQLNSLNVEGNWQALAREALRDELDSLQRTLTINLLQCTGGGEDDPAHLQDWLQQHTTGMRRWRSLLAELRSNAGASDYAMYVVANRTLFELVQQGRQ